MKDDIILLEFRHAYNKCLECRANANIDKKRFAFEQRIDEILLLYSALFNVSVNEAMDVLVLEDER